MLHSMNAGIRLETSLSRHEVAQWAAVQRHSEGWTKGYSLKNPRSTDDAVAMVQEARGVRLGICYVGAMPCDAHWLKQMHYAEGWACVDGVVWPEFRGGMHGVLHETWKRFAAWAYDQGYPDLLCASFVGNQKAYDWITDVCGFYEVGLFPQASPRATDSVLTDVVVFASDGHEKVLAEKRAREVYGSILLNE